MEEIPKPSTWERSTTRRFFHWLFSARTLRRGLIALIWVVSLIALYYGVVDWRGRRDWNAYAKEYEAHVAPLAFEAYVPKEVPDSENFTATPFVESWFKDRDSTNFIFDGHDMYAKTADLLSDSNPTHKGQKFQQKFFDLAAMQEAIEIIQSGQPPKPKKDSVPPGRQDLASRTKAAPVVLNAMKDDNAVLEELRQASAKSQARYPIEYKMDNPPAIILPHLARIKQTCARLHTRACAELLAGQTDQALEDVKLSLYFADSVKNEPFLISHLVRIACIRIAMSTVWEGLAEHGWTDAQIKELQARLEPYNFVEDLSQAFHAERAFGVRVIDLVKQNGPWWISNLGVNVVSSPDAIERIVQALVHLIIPSGWYDQEKLHYCQAFDRLAQASFDIADKRVFPHQAETNGEMWIHPAGFSRALWCHDLLSWILLPSLRNLSTRFATAQMTDEVVIACALERYHMANGKYPDNLQSLAPQFITRLPNDVISGEPYHYQLTADGRFVLYSVGWNERDDGGVSGQSQYDTAEGDWVWEYPKDP